MSKIKISVVICTHNRADLLRGAIESVLRQDFPKEEYELLIVDNASSDHTREMARGFCDLYPNVRYVMEPNVGLSHARNRGWQEARGIYVAYIDDDCKVPPTWLSAAIKVANQEHPAAFGGPYYAFYNVPKPAWFKDEYGSHVQGQEARPLRTGEYLDGGNMFLRVGILKSLGGFDPELGMKGKKIAYGEETRLFDLLRKETSGIVYYSPDVFVHHLVSPKKLGLWTNLRMNYSSGYYYAKISNQPEHDNLLHSVYRALRSILRIAISVTWDLLRRDRRLYPFAQNYLYEVTFPLITNLGYHTQQLGEQIRVGKS